MAIADGRNPDAIALGAGTLLIAPIGTLEPATRAEVWNAGFIELGYTSDGSEFSTTITSEKVEVAEELEALKWVTTGRESNVKFKLAQITADNLSAAYNGGTITVSGGDVTFEPPALGTETRVMIGWDSLDGTERWVFRQCLNAGAVTIPRKKGVAKAEIPCEFRLEKPAGQEPFKAILSAVTPDRLHNAA